MIGNVAQKRTHLAALAVLVALAVALFAVFQSAQADGHEHLTLSVGDSDNIVGDDQEVKLTITVNNLPADAEGNAIIQDSTYSINWVAIPAALPVTASEDDIGDDFEDVANTRHASNADTKFFIPKGTSGEYTISAQVLRDKTVAADGTDEGQKVLNGSVTITIGDAGTAVAAASISLGKVGHATPKTAKTDGAATAAYGASAPADYEACQDDPVLRNVNPDPENDTDPVDVIDGNCVALTISVTNSLGNAANGSDVTGIHVFAPLGQVIWNNPSVEQNASDLGSGTALIGAGSASVKIFVARMTAGTVNVSAIVLGKAGSTTSDVMTLTFTGAADSISVSGADSALAQNGTAAKLAVEASAVDETPVVVAADAVASEGEARIVVTAVDASGNVATLAPDQVDVEIVDADDNLVTSIGSLETPQVDAKGNTVHTAVRITLNATDAAPGEYTVKVTFGDDDPETATVVVAGAVATVEIETSATSVAIGDIITVSATVTDDDGNLSPDVGEVTFQAVGALTLNALGKGADGGNVSIAVDDGMAEARFVVVSGSGTATIIASTAGVDGVTSVSTDAAAAADEAVSLDCLSATNGFATYTCGVDSSASELFGLVSGRGATAVHLWNGSDWVRYSVVDGAMVPGSSDFSVTEDDILYISN